MSLSTYFVLKGVSLSYIQTLGSKHAWCVAYSFSSIEYILQRFSSSWKRSFPPFREIPQRPIVVWSSLAMFEFCTFLVTTWPSITYSVHYIAVQKVMIVKVLFSAFD